MNNNKNIGIYKITNLINNKFYIGSSSDLKKRLYEHRRELNLGVHANKHLQSAWNKYGEENFKFEIPPVDSATSTLADFSQKWMKVKKNKLLKNGRSSAVFYFKIILKNAAMAAFLFSIYVLIHLPDILYVLSFHQVKARQ